MTIFAWRFFASRGDELRSVNKDLMWPLPKDGKPGAWVKHDGQVVLCESGLHASPTVYDALQERQGDTFGLVEASEPECVDASKFATREMRIIQTYDRKHLVGLATWAAILALPIYEKENASKAPRKCIETVIAWIDGKATVEDVRAARSAAYAYAYADAAAAAYAAAYAAYADAAAAAYADADAAAAYAAAYAAAAAAYAYAAYADAAAAYAAARKAMVDKFNAGSEELLALLVEDLPTRLSGKLESA